MSVPTPPHDSLAIQLDSRQAVTCAMNFESIPTIVGDDKQGEFTTPMLACYDEDDWLVGTAARDFWLDNPDRVIVTNLLRHLENQNSSVESDTVMPATRILTQLLQQLRRRVQLSLASLASHCVFTVPPWFTETGRRKLIETATLAGLQCRAIVDRSVSAASFQACQRQKDGRLLSLDFSWDATTASLLEPRGDQWEVMQRRQTMQCHTGLLVEWLAKRIPGRSECSMQDAQRHLMCRWMAERALREMGSDQLVHRRWVMSNDGPRVWVVSRRQLNEMARPIARRGLQLLRQVLPASRSRWNEHVAGVVLVGDPLLTSLARKLLRSNGCSAEIWDDASWAAPALGAALIAEQRCTADGARADASVPVRQPRGETP